MSAPLGWWLTCRCPSPVGVDAPSFDDDLVKPTVTAAVHDLEHLADPNAFTDRGAGLKQHRDRGTHSDMGESSASLYRVVIDE
jgi:hypothetical protein